MKTKYECSGCGWEFDHGFDLCRGCGSTIVYGATDIELVNAGKWFGAIPLMLGFVVAALFGAEYYKAVFVGVIIGWPMFFMFGYFYREELDSKKVRVRLSHESGFLYKECFSIA